MRARLKEKRSGRFVGAAKTNKELAEWRRFQRKNLSILGLLKRKEWPQCHNESGWQVRQNHLRQKEKEQSRLSKVPDHKVGESQGEREPYLAEREREVRAGAWRGKGGLYRVERQVPRRRGRASKKSFPRKCRRKHKRVSGRKSFPGGSAES